MKRFIFYLALGAMAGAVAACGPTSDDTGAATATSALTIRGQVDMSSFGGQVTSVRVTSGADTVAEALVDAAGAFAVTVPSGTGYLIEFVRPDGSSSLVFPRQAGVIDQQFDVAGSGDFDLGVVRHIGDPAAWTFQFANARRQSGDASNGAPDESDGDGECEDGVDSATGALCVDDDGEHYADACRSSGADDESDDESDEDGADDEDETGVDCVDGIDAATGAECDGGPDAQDDDDESDEDGDEDADGAGRGVPRDAAIADHNLPASAGCADDEGEDDADGVDCEDGIDAATGAWCDGGPAANGNDGEDD